MPTFTSPQLNFRAVTYTDRSLPFTLTEETITLTKIGGEYTVGADELLVEVHSAALNPVDLMIYQSAYPIFGSKPKGTGSDYSGVVVKVGSNLTSKFAEGDRVAGVHTAFFGTGTLSEYLVLNYKKESSILKVSRDLKVSDNELAAWPLTFSTAAQALESHSGTKPLDEESNVLIIGGATAVGQYFIQLAKTHYKVKTVVSVNSPSSNEFVRELGADYTIDYTTHANLLQPTVNLVKGELKGEKFDFIFDAVGNSDFFAEIDTVLKPRAEGSAYSTIVGDSKADYNVNNFTKIVTSLGLVLRSLRSYFGIGPNYSFAMLNRNAALTDFGVKMLEENKLKVVIDSVFPLEQATEAYARLASNKARGKIVIEVKSTST